MKSLNTEKASNSLFLILIICTSLNLNGFFYMAFGITQLVSVIIYLSILSILALMLINKKQAKITDFSILFFSFLLIYTSLSTINFLFINENVGLEQIVLFVSYFSSVVLFGCLSLVFKNLKLEFLPVLERWLIFCMIVNVLMVPLSFFYRVYLLNPPLEVARGFGMFANANEAGIFCCYSICFFLYKLRESNRTLLYTSLAVLAWFGTVLTFSKSAILISTALVVTFYIFFHPKKYFLIVILTVPILLVSDVSIVIDFLNSLGLDPVQLTRITQVLELVSSGDVNADTTSARSELWGKGLASISAYPFGVGIGELHHFKDFLNNMGEPQGVHNFYLMIFGEAGIIPLVLYLIFILLLMCFSGVSFLHSKNPKYFLSFAIIMVVTIDSLVSHNIMLIKFNILFISIGIYYYYSMKQSDTKLDE